MTSERWRQVEDLFHSALSHAPVDRAAFLDVACADDRAMREQVEGLLESLEEAGDFIEKPLLEGSLSLREITPSPSQSIIGRKIGNYEILSLIGAGGMGEVYLARDVRLDRRIALKILPAQFTQDPAQVERFEREARAASALNHPNIITIYEIGREGDTHFIATEFIEGHTLREIIAGEKTQLREGLAIAIQVADALATAHTAGIVHRDIKPENVMVRGDGLVKLLDFGLAKPMKSETTTGNLQKPGAVSLQTEPRMLMGTLAYLSPEQARGEKVDHRTDIFSLGVVLYEMIAGTRPFSGENSAAILDAILNRAHEPVMLERQKSSDELNSMISRALEKDRQARYQSANDLRDDLQRLARRLEMAEEIGDRQRSQPGRSPGSLTKAAALAAVISVATAA